MLSSLLTLGGFAGAAMVIVAYFANQQGWLSTQERLYSLANLLGASLILASLFAQWNFPAALIEGFWAAISLYGLIRQSWRRKVE